MDAFPTDPAESVDSDSDGIGNVADTDDDNDGVLDANDAFPLDADEVLDTDGDGIGNNADTDDDNDGLPDVFELGAGAVGDPVVIHIAGDDGYELYQNGTLLGAEFGWQIAEAYDSAIADGRTVFAVKGINAANGTHDGVVIVDIRVNGQTVSASSALWNLAESADAGWNTTAMLTTTVPATEFGGVDAATWWGRSQEYIDASNFPMDSEASGYGRQTTETFQKSMRVLSSQRRIR